MMKKKTSQFSREFRKQKIYTYRAKDHTWMIFLSLFPKLKKKKVIFI